MGISELFRRFSREDWTNLSRKIENPPKLKSRPSFCMWSDLLGFSSHFTETDWILNDIQREKIYNRLLAAHSSLLYYSKPDERYLILNDGIAKIYKPDTKQENFNNILAISLFFNLSVQFHLKVNGQEKADGYPGCRTVIAYGESIEYLADEVRYDDYVINYTKPEGSDMSDLAKSNGNPLIIYNPAELQMNTAFSKAYILEGGGSKVGLAGNSFYIDQSAIDAVIEYSRDKGYIIVWQESPRGKRLLIPYEESNLNKVVLGFEFETTDIQTSGLKYNNTVYKLKKFFPHDELIDEFCFNLEI